MSLKTQIWDFAKIHELNYRAFLLNPKLKFMSLRSIPFAQFTNHLINLSNSLNS